MSTSTAILVGSVIIASGLGLGAYFGLRSSRPDTPSRTSAREQGTTAATTSAPPAGDVAADEALSAKVIQQVKAELEARRPELKRKCWDAPAAKSPGPPLSRFAWSFTFDAGGKQLARGISEDRETLRPGTSICLSNELGPIEIAPPGKTVAVKVDFALP